MNSGLSAIFFLIVLILFQVVKCEGWTNRGREPVNRSGVLEFDQRRTKDEKGEKKDKKDKSEKSEKTDKDSKKSKYQYIENGMNDYHAAHHSNHNYNPTGEGYLDEDIVRDFNDLYEDFYERHFSFGSMSMDHAQPIPSSSQMLALEQIKPLDQPTSSPSKVLSMIAKHHMEYNEKDEKVSISSQDDVEISFALYSLTFSFMDNVIPTRREDYSELVTLTKSILRDFMIRYYDLNTVSDLNDFHVEFVRTGVSEQDEIFIVFQSTAVFKSDSYLFPEAHQVQDILGDALDRDKQLWMEYIAALQELNPDNAFSSTVNVVYTKGIPNDIKNIQSTPSSTRADGIAYSAAASITMLSIIVLSFSKYYDQKKIQDPLAREKKSASKLVNDCESTIAETLTYVSSSICEKQDQSFGYRKDEEVRPSMIELYNYDSIDRRSHMYNVSSSDLNQAIEDNAINEELSERIRDIDNYRIFSFGTEKSEDKLRAELKIIEAEEAARTAEELRLKKERRLAVDRESLEIESRLREYARRAKQLKLEKLVF